VRSTKSASLVGLSHWQNLIIISTNVTIMLAFCPTQKGVMLPVLPDAEFEIDVSLKARAASCIETSSIKNDNTNRSMSVPYILRCEQ
jgi:hypothetical protein